MAVLVDSSVVIDVLNVASPWRHWAVDALKTSRRKGVVCINPVVLAECFAGPRTATIPEFALFEQRELPWASAPIAGAAYGAYKQRGGSKDAILADFLIGAHAFVEGLALLTRDPRRIAAAFPDVRLITPETEPL